MSEQVPSVAIVGGGLSGLLTAYRLQQTGIVAVILEAKPQLGGRIATVSHAGAVGEYGGTWFGPQHQRMHALLAELQLGALQQFRPGVTLQQVHPMLPVQHLDMAAFDPATMRIADGSVRLIAALADTLPPAHLRTNWSVQSLTVAADAVHLTNTQGAELSVAQVVLAGPPKNMLQMMTLAAAAGEMAAAGASRPHVDGTYR